jgi:hypothetical protein
MSKIKILISTDSAALQSGLAETTRNIFIPLLKFKPEKYELHQLGFFHWQPKEQVPWPIYRTRVNKRPDGQLAPDEADKWGEITSHELISKLTPDIVFGYGDMWHFNHLLYSPLRNTYRLAVYYTIDGQPYFGHLNDDGTTAWGKNLTKADEIVTLSHFGRRTLKEGCSELADKDIHVAYHALDMTRFSDKTNEEILDIRKQVFPPIIAHDSFIMGWCGRNQFRKQNYKLWEVLHYLVYGDYIECNECGKITIKEWNHSSRKTMDPDRLTMYDPGYRYDYCWYCKGVNISEGIPNNKCYLWLHMPKNDPGYNPELHERIWKVSDKSMYTSSLDHFRGIPRDDVISMMQAWDCMFYPSGGEGFGNPPYECLAAGTPIVYSNYSSHAEFCKFGGLPVRVNYIPELHHGIMRSIIDTGDAVKQLLKLIRSKELCHKLGARGKLHVSQYHITHMVEFWDKLFTNMMKKPLPTESEVLYTSVIS